MDLQLLRLSFRQLDKEGLGHLTTEQFLSGLKDKGIEIKDEKHFREVVLPAVDLNGSDSINFTEFL